MKIFIDRNNMINITVILIIVGFEYDLRYLTIHVFALRKKKVFLKYCASN